MLVVMVGLPGSGKSTYAGANFRNLVSPDRIRIEEFGTEFDPEIEPEVWRRAFERTRALLAGRAVVCFDATSVTRARRQRLVRLAAEAAVPAVAIWLRTSAEVAWERNQARERTVPRAAFWQLAQALEPPAPEEGFTAVIEVGAPS